MYTEANHCRPATILSRNKREYRQRSAFRFHTWRDGKREKGSSGSDEEYPKRIPRATSSPARPLLGGAAAAGVVIVAAYPRRGAERSRSGLHVEDDIGLLPILLFLFSIGLLLAISILGQVGSRRCAMSTRRSRPVRVAGTAVAVAAAGTVDRRLTSIHGLREQRRRRWPATCHRGRLRSSTYPARDGRGYTRASTTCGSPVPHPACDTVRPGDTIAAARHHSDLGRATTSHRHTQHQPINQPINQPKRINQDHCFLPRSRSSGCSLLRPLSLILSLPGESSVARVRERSLYPVGDDIAR